MSTAAIIQAIIDHQRNPNVHPLTCGNDSRHEPVLEPREENGHVYLLCPVCGYRQDWIPGCIEKGGAE